MLARQDALEEADKLGRVADPHHEIGAGEGEDNRHLRLVGDQRIDLDTLPLAWQERNHQRPLLVTGVDTPDQVRALIAIQA